MSFKVGDKVLVVGEVRAVSPLLPLFCDVRVGWDGSDAVVVECDGAQGDVIAADTVDLLVACEGLLADLDGDPEDPFGAAPSNTHHLGDGRKFSVAAVRAAVAKLRSGA